MVSPSPEARAGDAFSEFRAKLALIGERVGEWAGIPMPLEGERTVVTSLSPGRQCSQVNERGADSDGRRQSRHLAVGVGQVHVDVRRPGSRGGQRDADAAARQLHVRRGGHAPFLAGGGIDVAHPHLIPPVEQPLMQMGWDDVIVNDGTLRELDEKVRGVIT